MFLLNSLIVKLSKPYKCKFWIIYKSGSYERKKQACKRNISAFIK